MTGMTDSKAADVLAELERDGNAGLTARERHALAHAAARLREPAGVVAFDAAVAAELPRVSHIEYDSHEICKHFAAKVRERIAAAPQPPPRAQAVSEPIRLPEWPTSQSGPR